jgi:hypothetical protein
VHEHKGEQRPGAGYKLFNIAWYYQPVKNVFVVGCKVFVGNVINKPNELENAEDDGNNTNQHDQGIPVLAQPNPFLIPIFS